MRRPKLTAKRIRGLQLAAERLRPLSKCRAGNGVFTMTVAEMRDLRTAIRYLDELVRWSEGRGKSDGGA